MRRFSSEGNLLDLDFFPWRKVALKNSDNEKNRNSGTYTLTRLEKDKGEHRGSAGLTGAEYSVYAGEKRELTKEHSISAENMSEMGKQDKNLLGVCDLSESCRAYSDSQLAPPAQGSGDSVDGGDASPSLNPFCYPHQQEHHHRAKLSTAKLHLKMLFGQSPHSSNNNLFNAEQKDSAKERRSRLLFMRQWSQVGHGRKRRISREELESWAQSLNSLLDSPTGVSVFREFLRSEFSEENLQFYLACEQYRHSSNNFSLQRRAKDICATYIQPGSPREVNLDSKTRELTIQLLQAPSHTSLNHAQRRIYSLLDMDCYPRFMQSSVYTSLLQEAD